MNSDIVSPLCLPKEKLSFVAIFFESNEGEFETNERPFTGSEQ